MKRLVAAFDDGADVDAARDALREAGLDPSEPDVDDPFFDPTVAMPEERGLAWGGLLGGFLGAVLLLVVSKHLVSPWRFAPIMTAGPIALVFLGFGLGAASGGFLGGLLGTYRDVSERKRPRVAVVVSEGRVGEATSLLHDHGAAAVDSVASHHEHPQASTADSGRTGGSGKPDGDGRDDNGKGEQ
ncbi:hypothetical protein [Halomicrobium salinisoli]|uniref:hypothetical protein n=1 Tax=Halomicrobium salinisoli TaxID=2878391 RepID=UPI001CEFDA79|nr:hypothetical protein [Halomicrobium salinisoli]